MKNIVIGFSENIEFYDTYMHTHLCLSFTYVMPESRVFTWVCACVRTNSRNIRRNNTRIFRVMAIRQGQTIKFFS
jgi:hypothetical protein